MCVIEWVNKEVKTENNKTIYFHFPYISSMKKLYIYIYTLSTKLMLSIGGWKKTMSNLKTMFIISKETFNILFCKNSYIL